MVSPSDGSDLLVRPTRAANRGRVRARSDRVGRTGLAFKCRANVAEKSRIVSSGQRIAVVGGGIAGLTAAYILSSAKDVTLYEANDRLGGHAHTHRVRTPEGSDIFLDSGFITFSRRSYPYLCRLFDELGVESDETRFSFAIHCDGCGLEYLLAHRMPGLRPRVRAGDRAKYASLLSQIPVFNRKARLLARSDLAEHSLSFGDFLLDGRFTKYFTQHYVVPLIASLWSCPPEIASEYPARFVARYLNQHGLLSIYKSNHWRTVRGGSHEYVKRVAQTLTDVRLSTPVQAVRRTSSGVTVYHSNGQVDAHDAVVMATHANDSLRLLADADALERSVLGVFGYSRNVVTIHTDGSVLSDRSNARATWNFHMSSCAPQLGMARITYHMNKLQGFDAVDSYLVTLNDAARVRKGHVLAEVTYEHPIDNVVSVHAREHLPKLNSVTTAFAGAYLGWSSHEDGCRSGVDAAASLGVQW